MKNVQRRETSRGLQIRRLQIADYKKSFYLKIFQSSNLPSGFTLIEMLVVIVIIGILTALVMSGIMKAGESSKIQATRAIAKQISAGLDSYQNRFGDYPPTSLEAFKVILPNDINNGIETLVACLATNNGGPFYQFDESFLMNSDGDFQKALLETGKSSLSHSIGSSDPHNTVFIYFHFR